MWILFFIVVLLLSIVLHEAGHFSMAKLFNMKATQFFVGFGKTIWSFKRGETEYGFKWIPAGGYIRILGMSPYDESFTTEDEATGRLYFQQATYKKFLVAFAGVFINLIFGMVLVFTALVFVGRPIQTTQVASIVPGKAAQLAGIVADDTIVAIDNKPVGSFMELIEQISPHPGEQLSVTYNRNGAEHTVELTVDTHESGRGIIGIYPAQSTKYYSAGEAITEMTTGPFAITTQISVVGKGLASVFSPSGLTGLVTQIAPGGERQENTATSIVGIGQIIGALGDQGQVFAIFMVLSQLNVVLAVLNLLPFPPFDGGHIAVMTIESIANARRRAKGITEPYYVKADYLVRVALTVIFIFLLITILAVIGDVVNPASQLVE